MENNLKCKNKSVVRGYKAFNKDMTCKGFKFEEGKTYKCDKAEICKEGFYLVLNPLDALDYYDITDCVFHEVEALGKIDKHKNDTKIATTEIKIGIKMDLKACIKASVDFCFSICKLKKTTASGDYSKQVASGDSSKQAASGDSSKQAASGDSSKQAASGDYSTQAASGDYSTQAASGDSSKQAASGDYSKQAASGDSSKQAASGDYSTQAASGYSSKQELMGKDSVAVSAGHQGKSKGKLGCWICLSEWKKRDDGSWFPFCVKAGQIDGKEIKEDVWYQLEAGNFVEANQNVGGVE